MLEFITDHLMVILIPYFQGERAEFNHEMLNQITGNPDNAFWSGRPHLYEVWLNAIIHFFVAGSVRTITFTQITNKLEALQTEQKQTYEGIDKVALPIEKPRSQKELTYYAKQLAYFFSGGEKDNLGSVVGRGYISRLRSLQMLIVLQLSMRMGLTDQGLVESMKAFLLFHFAGMWIFGWPWELISGGAKINGTYLAKNKEKLDTLIQNFSKISRETYTSESEYREVFEKSIKEVAELYLENKKLDSKSVKAMQSVINKNLHNSIKANALGDLSNEQIKEISSSALEVIRQSPALPTAKNTWADISYTTAFGGYLTTYLFILLSVWTFTPEYLTWGNIAMWGAFSTSAYFLLYHGYKRGLKGWKDFFHEKIIRTGRSAKNTCRAIFNRKGSSPIPKIPE